MKKDGQTIPALTLTENPDILHTVSHHPSARPRLVVGFAAETEHLLRNADAKRRRKGCDWLVANDVGAGTGTFGGDENSVLLLIEDGVEDWPKLTKGEVARRLARRIADHLAEGP
jgi:phosphopantothenoylcysteine decarboxylase/phosphopantothenate--cysteine ligase